MEIETMSSAFEGFKIHTSDGEGVARPARGIRGIATGKKIIGGKVGANTRREGRPLRDANRIGEERTRRESRLLRDGIKPVTGKKNPPPRDKQDEGAIPIYRLAWETRFGGVFGSFDDETTIGPNRYSSGPIPENVVPASTLQICSVKVTELEGTVDWWPLHVYGLVATRDNADHNRNFLFRRTRDNCQILTQEDPALLLAGPSRAVVLAGVVTFEVHLVVKGNKTESADRVLVSKFFNFHQGCPQGDNVVCTRNISYLGCTLEFAIAPLRHSVEATVTVQLVQGSWPDSRQGLVFSSTDSIKGAKMVLLDSRDGRMPIGPDGVFELSRRVVCAELSGRDKLMVFVQARRGCSLTRNQAVFEPKMSGTSVGMCDLRFCKMQVTVAWSLLSTSGKHAGDK